MRSQAEPGNELLKKQHIESNLPRSIARTIITSSVGGNMGNVGLKFVKSVNHSRLITRQSQPE